MLADIFSHLILAFTYSIVLIMTKRLISSFFEAKTLSNMLGAAKMVCQTPLIFSHDIGLALLSNNSNISNGSYIM